MAASSASPAPEHQGKRGALSRWCEKLGLLVARAPVQVPLIEPGIAPLCAALNRNPALRTVWSCEGHPWRPLQRPYVVFVGPQSFAFALNEALRPDKGRNTGLRFFWRVTAYFHDDGSLQFLLEPSDRRFNDFSRLGLPRWTRAQADGDLALIERLIEELTGAA
jgi:hypothetical protein